MADHLFEAGMGIVEAETDAVPRKDVHLLEELFVEDPRLLQDATLLGDVVLRLRHGAQPDSRGAGWYFGAGLVSAPLVRAPLGSVGSCEGFVYRCRRLSIA